MCREAPDYSNRDLWGAVEKGEEIERTAHVLVMNPKQADPDKLGFDPFDVTKVWPRSQFPMKDFGRLVLNKNPGTTIEMWNRLRFRLAVWFLVLRTLLTLFFSSACSSTATLSTVASVSICTQQLRSQVQTSCR